MGILALYLQPPILLLGFIMVMTIQPIPKMLLMAAKLFMIQTTLVFTLLMRLLELFMTKPQTTMMDLSRDLQPMELLGKLVWRWSLMELTMNTFSWVLLEYLAHKTEL